MALSAVALAETFQHFDRKAEDWAYRGEILYIDRALTIAASPTWRRPQKQKGLHGFPRSPNAGGHDICIRWFGRPLLRSPGEIFRFGIDVSILNYLPLGLAAG